MTNIPNEVDEETEAREIEEEIDPEVVEDLLRRSGTSLQHPMARVLVEHYTSPSGIADYLRALGWPTDTIKQMRVAVQFRQSVREWKKFWKGARRPAQYVWDKISPLNILPDVHLSDDITFPGGSRNWNNMPVLLRELSYNCTRHDPLCATATTTYDACGSLKPSARERAKEIWGKHVERDASTQQLVTDLSEEMLYQFWHPGQHLGCSYNDGVFSVIRVAFDGQGVNAKIKLGKSIEVVTRSVILGFQDPKTPPQFYKLVGIHQGGGADPDEKLIGITNHVRIAVRQDIGPNHKCHGVNCDFGTMVFERRITFPNDEGLSLRVPYKIDCTGETRCNDDVPREVIHYFERHQRFQRKSIIGVEKDKFSQAFLDLRELYQRRELSPDLEWIIGEKLIQHSPADLSCLFFKQSAKGGAAL